MSNQTTSTSFADSLDGGMHQSLLGSAYCNVMPQYALRRLPQPIVRDWVCDLFVVQIHRSHTCTKNWMQAIQSIVRELRDASSGPGAVQQRG